VANTYTIEGIVIKRRDYGEADRIVTLFSKEKGKITVLAKGVRKLNSKRIGSLELGTLIRTQIIQGKSMDIMTQTVIINSFPHISDQLGLITRSYQIFEIIDMLTGEEQDHPDLYQLILAFLTKLNQEKTYKKAEMLHLVQQILATLGFTDQKMTSELDLKAKIEQIAEKRLHSKEFFSPGKNLS